MSIWEAIIFGIVQGLTEFLPISSTAHIVITERLLGYSFPGLTFEIFLHLASVLAVIIYFYKDWIRIFHGSFNYLRFRRSEDRVYYYLGIYIVLATVITGILGLVISDLIGDGLKSAWMIASALVVTGLFLIFIERLHKIGERDISQLTWRDAIIVGIAQAIAVLPGISRSGSTLVAALWVGLDRETAVRYSFLLAVPVILGSTMMEFGDFNTTLFASLGIPAMIIAFVTTFIFSLIGIVWLINFVKRSKLLYFAIYCFVAAAFVLFYFEATAIFA